MKKFSRIKIFMDGDKSAKTAKILPCETFDPSKRLIYWICLSLNKHKTNVASFPGSLHELDGAWERG